MTPNLQELATSAAAALETLWGAIGVPADERAAFVAQLGEDVAAIYAARVAGQAERKAAIEAEIDALNTTCANMLIAMEETRAPIVAAGRPLIAFRDALEAARAGLQEMWDARSLALKTREGTLFQLYADIGAGIEPAFATVGDRISIARTNAYDGEIARVSAIKAQRGAHISALAAEIAGFWEELGFGPKDEYENSIARGALHSLGWSLALIAVLQGKVETLSAEKCAREEKIMVMGQTITALWKRLATPEEEQTAFLEAHAGIGDDVIAACEKYLSDKQREFGVRVVELIATARSGIEQLWTAMRMGNAQRESAFPGMFAPESAFNDDLFLAHEAYAASASATLEEMKPMLRAIEKRDALLADKVEYDGIIADPNRLIKGSSSARLREEKLERRVKKELPAYNKRLKAQCVEWEAAHGGAPFLIDGVRFADTLDTDEAAEARARGDARAQREARMRGEGEAGGAEAAAGAGGAPPAAAAAAGGSAAMERTSRATSNSRASVMGSVPVRTVPLPAPSGARAPLRKTSQPASSASALAAMVASTSAEVHDADSGFGADENDAAAAPARRGALPGGTIPALAASTTAALGRSVAGNARVAAKASKPAAPAPPAPEAVAGAPVSAAAVAGAEAFLSALS